MQAVKRLEKRACSISWKKGTFTLLNSDIIISEEIFIKTLTLILYKTH